MRRGELAGVALVAPPRKRLAAALAVLWSALRFLPLSVSLGRRASRLENTYYATVRAAAPREPHHYLVMLGVEPRWQGTGVGGRLARDAIALAAAHPASTGLALDTENHANAVVLRGARLHRRGDRGRRGPPRPPLAAPQPPRRVDPSARYGVHHVNTTARRAIHNGRID